MAYDVKFLRGTAEAYKALTEKNDKVFYYLTDTKQLYLGSELLSNTPEVNTVATALENYKTSNDARVKKVEDNIGDITTFTEVGTTVSAAIVKLATDIKTAQNAGEVTVSTEKTTDGMSKSYTFTQNGKTITVVDIPKDMVVSGGEVVKNPDGQKPGTYICLTLANAEQSKLYIDVAGLVDTYTAAADATEVQVAFDGYKVSATLVDGGVSEAKIAADAVITSKIKDGNVTKTKLEADVQESLGKADSAVQTVVEGTANGEILVDGEAVKVHGLGSAAYQNVDAFDAKDAAANVKAELLGEAETPAAETIRYVQKAVDKEVEDRKTAVSTVDGKVTALETKVNEALGDGGNVATQITDAINKLDANKAVSKDGMAVTGITQVDGVITEIAEHDFAKDIADAKQAAIDAAAADATSKAETAEANAKADAKTKADTAESNAKAYADTKKGEAIEAAATDATTKADQALTDAKAYVDEGLTWGTF